jgi:hypothetical protein
MKKFYVKLWMPATEMYVLFSEHDSWAKAIEYYEWLTANDLKALVGRNSGLFDDEEERG